MTPDKTKGIAFAHTTAEQRAEANKRLSERLSPNARHKAEREAFVADKTYGEKLSVPGRDDIRTFAEWQHLRRTDRVSYNRLSNNMARDRELLGELFFSETGTGAELYLQRQVDRSDAALEAGKSIFGSD